MQELGNKQKIVCEIDASNKKVSEPKLVPNGTRLSDDSFGKLFPRQKSEVPYILLLQHLQGETELKEK
jgi:hypothetical protein